MEALADSYRFGPLDSFSILNGDAVLKASYFDDSNESRQGKSPIHAGDRDPVRLYALEGSICGDPGGQCAFALTKRQGASLTFPKPVDAFAGKDVFRGAYTIQNNSPNDVSRLRAGRDLYDVALEIGGEGAAVLEAGRNIQMDYEAIPSLIEYSGLLLSEGNLKNSTLPADKAGASLYLMAGTAAGVDWRAFADAYLDPANATHVTRSYLPELATYMKVLGYASMSDAELVAAFKSLPLVRQEVFLGSVYFTELKEAGIDYNDSGSARVHSYQRGLDAVSRLFPGNPFTSPTGNVIFNAKPVETQAIGSISILAPYGGVAVGAEKFDTSSSAKGGIVTRRGGDIRIMADQNIDLFTSRVFTMQGGDIEMWTTNGSITAGSGSKTAVFDAPLRYLMSSDGVVAIDVFGLQTGAGIGVLDALQNAKGRPKSRLDLIAPRGEVNAGDAGIRVVGDLNIAARAVVGLDNIQVSGISVGVPKIETPNIGALTNASQLAQAATKEGVGPESAAAAAAARKTLAELPSIITVEVVGYETPAAGDRTGDPKKKKH